MGMLDSKCVATIVEADENLIWPIPDNWTLEDAATIIVTYATVFYALVCITTEK